MQPVWVLSVDLQTKTATFQSGLSDAAKSARGAFSEIKQGSGEMGREVSGNMMEARHGVILLGEEFGVHLPRGVTSFLASIGPVGAAMEAAFPFLAIAVGATILIEHLVKMHEAGEKLTEDQGKFGTAVNNAFNQLDTKLIQAQIRADELRNDHLGALKLQLELIDKQSMEELVHSFEEVAKAGDIVMKELTGSWYTFGKGSEGAKHALDEFQNKYTQLLSTGKDADASQASGLLHGTLSQAQKALGLLQQIQTAGRSNAFGSFADPAKFHEAEDALNKMGIAHGETVQKQIEAQQNLVGVLSAQVGAEERIAALKKLEGANDTTATNKTMSAQASGGAREAAESQQRIAQQGLTAARAVAEAQLTIKRASAQERLAVDLDFANREYAIQMAGNEAQVKALDKMAADYPNALKALHDKALELTAAHNAQMTELTAKSSVAQANKDLAALEQSEREKIEATQKGSAARLSTINDAIRQEEAAGLQDTNYYRELLNQRVELTEQMTETQAKLAQEAGKEAADNAQKMGELAVQAQKQADALKDSSRRVSEETRMAQEIAVANAEYEVKVQALAREIAALDKNGQEYQNKLKELQDKEKQLVQAHENEITAIKEKAEEERNQRILSADTRFNDQIASGLTSVLMRHESFAKMVTTLGDQVVAGMIQNAIKMMMTDDMTKAKDAAAAARKAYNLGLSIGGPAGVVLGPVMGAAAFAAVMAFQGGTDMVPGVGTGDIVPARLEPGEGVVPRDVMGQLRDLSKNGGLSGSGGSVTHVHVKPVYHVNTVDGDGMQDALEKHTDVLTKHFETTLRKMNR
jgi:hypothetical protein